MNDDFLGMFLQGMNLMTGFLLTILGSLHGYNIEQEAHFFMTGNWDLHHLSSPPTIR